MRHLPKRKRRGGSQRSLEAAQQRAQSVPEFTTADKYGDRAWFAAHPDRAHRFRPACGDEIALGYGPFIIVRQVVPGARVRLSVGTFAPAGRDPSLAADVAFAAPEEFLHAMFDALRASANRSVLLDEVWELARSRAGLGGHA